MLDPVNNKRAFRFLARADNSFYAQQLFTLT